MKKSHKNLSDFQKNGNYDEDSSDISGVYKRDKAPLVE